MNILTARQQDIIDLAKNRGHVDVENLAEHFQVTPQTIRRDLNFLCEQKYLGRVHGGAVHLSSVTNFEYHSRRHIAAEGKEKIAQATAEIIPDNASLIMNIGTTTEQVAHALSHHKGLMVITNNLNIANIMMESPEAEVLIAGGIVRRPDGGIIGAPAVEFIRNFKVDYAVIGVSAIDEDGSLLDFDFREVRVSQAILEQAREVILVTDGMKFDRRAPVQIGDLSQINTFVTDKTPPKEIVELCKLHNVRLIVTGPDEVSELESD
ncbi:DeoR/GlpR family DNA-binding transcription regulator [Curvivirga sp.]|uniref:DeoR/GlpR family DNA-binding transcription regulator n=1 Tax=Curvivirga sp. TaxID=2856848 RepID=UPI003B5C6EE0